MRDHHSPPVWSTLFYTHTHTHTECPLKWCCHQQSPITALCQQSILYTVNGFRNGMALPITLITPPTIHPEPCRQRTSSLSHQTEQDQLPYTSCQHPLPVHSEHNAGAVIAGLRQTNSPHGQLKDAVHSPTSVRTIPRFPIRASTIIDVKCNCTGSPHTNLHPTPHPHEQVHHPLLYNLGQYHQ